MFSKDLKPMVPLFEKRRRFGKGRESERRKSDGHAVILSRPKKYRLTADQFIAEFCRIPQERRRTQTVREAWREIVIRRFPC